MCRPTNKRRYRRTEHRFYAENVMDNTTQNIKTHNIGQHKKTKYVYVKLHVNIVIPDEGVSAR